MQPLKKHGRKRSHSELTDNDDCSCFINGIVLKDSHAEILARRGLMNVLWNEVENSLQNIPTSQPLLESIPSTETNTPQFQLLPDLSLHMYISDNPCGDASIYKIKKLIATCNKNSADQVDSLLNFTGAKIILSNTNDQMNIAKQYGSISISSTITCTNAANIVTVGREDVQQLGALRLKSSRSNIPSHLRSMSMSCSDKIVRWGVLGLQGALLSMYIPNPIVLSSICVSKDPRAVDNEANNLGQLEALQRALKERIKTTLGRVKVTEKGWNVSPPEVAVAVVNGAFHNSKSASEYRQDKRQHEKAANNSQTVCVSKESVCGTSINWQQSSCCLSNTDKRLTEITIGATGLKRGKKPKSTNDAMKAASRLSRYQFAVRCRKCSSLLPKPDTNVQSEEVVSYRKYKQRIANQTLTRVTSSILCGTNSSEGLLVSWVRSGSEDDFDLPK
jgi:tRNA-specific adenosine deaminase 1